MNSPARMYLFISMKFLLHTVQIPAFRDCHQKMPPRPGECPAKIVIVVSCRVKHTHRFNIILFAHGTAMHGISSPARPRSAHHTGKHIFLKHMAPQMPSLFKRISRQIAGKCACRVIRPQQIMPQIPGVIAHSFLKISSGLLPEP